MCALFASFKTCSSDYTISHRIATLHGSVLLFEIEKFGEEIERRRRADPRIFIFVNRACVACAPLSAKHISVSSLDRPVFVSSVLCLSVHDAFW